MSKRGIMGFTGGLILWAGSLAWADAPIPAPSAKAKSKAQSAPAIQSPSFASITQVTLAPGSGTAVPAFKVPTAAPSANPPAANASKAALADAFIAQNVLRVYLDRPAAVTVYNSRGQQVVHLDSRRAMEAVPLQGITTGFIYLTVRTAQGELTKKLVYTGK
jgi:hypothetical protein